MLKIFFGLAENGASHISQRIRDYHTNEGILVELHLKTQVVDVLVCAVPHITLKHQNKSQ